MSLGRLCKTHKYEIWKLIFKKTKELKEAAKPLIKYLCENYHPHVTAIVTPTSVEVMEGIQVIPNITEFIVD